MALIFKKSSETDRPALFSMSHQDVILVVGLGNIGKQYDHTRHNIGFDIVDRFAEINDFDKWIEKKDLKAHITQHTINNTRVILIKPTTYMNESGISMSAVQNYYKIPCSKTIVVHDELDLNFGLIRTRLGGSSAGNKGIESVINYCGSDFARIRVGINSDFATKMEKSDFVLAKFTQDEQNKTPSIINEACSLLSEYIVTGELPNHTLTLNL